MDRKRTIMKLSKFRRLVSLMCVVFMMCVIVAPAAAAANYDDQISPHFISCPECGRGDMERVYVTEGHNWKSAGQCADGPHYEAWSTGYRWRCNRCSASVADTSKDGHYCDSMDSGKRPHYCFGSCKC